MADIEGSLKFPDINFDKNFFTDIVKNVLSELKSSKNQPQSSPTNKNKHDTRNKQGTVQPTWDADMLGVMVSCITKALTPIIVQTVQTAISNLVPPPPLTPSVPQVEENIKLKLAIDDTNQYARRDSVRINGLVESENESEEDLVNKVIDVSNMTGAGIVKSDISIAHRLPAVIKGTRQVIIKFTSRNAKMAFYGSRSKLKDHSAGNEIYINEDLTKLRYGLLMQCKKCPGFKSAVTYNGVIKVRRVGFNDVVQVKYPADLEKIGLTPDYKALGLL